MIPLSFMSGQVVPVGSPATPTVPVTVCYELTDLGVSLYEMVRSLKAWAETHMDDVLAHRAAYDARTP
ncbi:winged helix-turn-helix transcriptional regulator [Microbispora hainanensis]|uniref:winged helix-turn-helix transcriptional regulator n=1 Tax=Microbispora hainanensis TaxID=568844 RepID=UPI001ABFFD2C|nr:winged helix-turn-helix transcriptional regulator [Microbispora hainanensis]